MKKKRIKKRKNSRIKIILDWVTMARPEIETDRRTHVREFLSLAPVMAERQAWLHEAALGRVLRGLRNLSIIGEPIISGPIFGEEEEEMDEDEDGQEANGQDQDGDMDEGRLFSNRIKIEK